MAGAGARRMLAPLRIGWRRSWFYRRLLKGALADHFVFHPHDALPRKLEDADALLRGRFRFHGQVVDVPAGLSVFDVTPPSAGLVGSAARLSPGCRRWRWRAARRRAPWPPT